MKEKPMLFSTLMVQALLKRQKTQTRRIINPQPIIDTESGHVYAKNNNVLLDIHKWKDKMIELCDYSIGQTIWVRETFMNAPNYPDMPEKYYYKASKSDQFLQEWKGCWKPSIFMPKDACRLFLTIKNIRIERLNEISEADAIAEGIIPLLQSNAQTQQEGLLFFDYSKNPKLFQDGLTPQKSYKTLWEKINGNDSWEQNPYVYVYDFEIKNKN